MNIYLMGMMGSGKSTVGKTLSQQLGKPFIDLDSEIEQSVGKTISEILKMMEKNTFAILSRINCKNILIRLWRVAVV